MPIVFTSITGGKDVLIDEQNTEGGEFVAFADTKSKVWEIKKPYDRFTSARRNSRVPKILSHQFIDSEYSLWLDGNLSLLVPVQELIDKYLKNHDIAMFKHPDRDCLYDEAMVCAKARLDDTETIINQVKGYEDKGFGKHRGLCEGMFILRRHTEKVIQFNNAWWAEYTRHSVRDQISMPFALDVAGLTPYVINEQFEKVDGNWVRGGIIQIVDHLTDHKEP